VRARTLTPDEALIDWLEGNGLKRIARRLGNSGALDVVATAVPGMKEILVLGKVKSLETRREADLVIVDAPAAGHAITFLMSAHGLLDAVRVGPVRKQASDVVELLSDPARAQVLLVTHPEETPVNELVDTAFALEDRVGVALGPVVVNGCYPQLGAPLDGDLTAASVQADADRVGVFVSEREAHDLATAAAFREERTELQHRQADRLAERLPLPQIRLPFLFSGDLHRREIEQLADAFAVGVEAL
jgi:anion-transporting  ArsA/GET3 family ATPase